MEARTVRFLVRYRGQLQLALDVAAWAAGLSIMAVLRYDFDLTRVRPTGLAQAVAAACVLQLLVGSLLHLYRGRYRFGSFEELAALASTVAATSTVLFVVDVLLFTVRPVPASVTLGGGTVALVAMATTRYVWRLGLEQRSRPDEGARRLLVYGAGEGGQQVLDAMLRDARSPWLPVALFDDDPRKRNLRVRGVPVVGGREALGAARERFLADTVLLAMPSADAVLIRELSGLADRYHLQVKVLPPVVDLIDQPLAVSDIRDLDVADLLGRRQIETDVDSIAHYLTGKRVLVTGAGGSIGSELCRQLARYAPDQLIMLDRDESALHAVQLSIYGRALLDDRTTVLADIRDVGHLVQLFEEHRPHVVFHAAALKHLPLLERYPGEAVKSNVWGTLTVLDAASAVKVERFVNISTDKAAKPESVLGFSKRLGERLTAHFGRSEHGTYLSVRFGNVLGSRGSVLTAFQAQIAAGGPVTVTDPEVTRYFMTVQEAVQLVIQAGAIGRPGEALVLDMGQPVRISDVAKRMVSEADRPVQIVYTGLRPGEKMYEDLLGEGEVDVRPVHELIAHVPVPPMDPQDARALDPWAAPEAVVAALRAACVDTRLGIAAE